ncbi:CAZyme family AA7 [Aspergillus niger]|nr:CAZyme family AA7 [Aspergillus niger]KAI3029659.1 CAZyme family AA7 [Aspergillus niger]
MRDPFALALLLSVVAYQPWALYLAEVCEQLGPQLSKLAVISSWDAIDHERWIKSNAPTPGVVVTPATEQDVAAIVSYCISNNISFLAQSGGHGWSQTLHLDEDGLLIYLKQLDEVTFSKNRRDVVVGGGASVAQVIEASSKNNALVQTNNCNCIGALGALLGGGYGSLMGMVGLGIDNIISLNLVMADGCLHTITPKDIDLFWALRGAGPNFGIVTSAKMKSYPVLASGKAAWTGQLVFSADKLEALVETMDRITLEPEMSVFLYFMTSGEPDNIPMVSLMLYYYGTEDKGRAAFSCFFDLGPTNDTTMATEYAHWTDASSIACSKSGFRIPYSAGLSRMVSSTWKEAWEEYVAFVSLGGTGQSLVLLEAFPLEKTRFFGQDSSAYAWRNKVNFNAMAIAWYFDDSLESDARKWASKMRDLWRSTDGLDSPAVYVPPLDPEPLQKWAGESYAVAQITFDIDSSANASLLSVRVDSAIAGLIALPECNNKQKFGILVYGSQSDYAPTFIHSLLDHISGTNQFAATVYHSIWDAASNIPSLTHIPGSQAPTTNGTNYVYPDVSSPGFIIPGHLDFKYSTASVAHTRSLTFLKTHLNGPYFDLEKIWAEHTYYEFDVRSVEKTMATMVQEPYVNHIPTMTGGIGRAKLSNFYLHHFIFNNPDDTALELISRTVGIDRVVDEFIFSFTHDKEVDWLIPGIPPTHKPLRIPFTSVVNIRGDRLYHEHIAWDQATVLVQLGLLPQWLPFPYQLPGGKTPAPGKRFEYKVPAGGVETAEKLKDESAVESNGMFGVGIREVDDL